MILTQRLTEKTGFSGRVDRSGPRPVVRGVLLCGPQSANRRRYRKECFAGARVKKYDNKPVFLNHGDGRSGRRYEDRIAHISNPRHREDGMPIGDLILNGKHPYAETFLDDAQHSPNSIGMSHVAHCSTRPASDGWDDVISLEEVDSVDVVLDPATTKGLFEGTHRKGKKMTTLAQLLHSIVSNPKTRESIKRRAKRLREDLDSMAGNFSDTAALGADAPEATGNDSTDISAAFMAAATALLKRGFDDPTQIDGVLQKLRLMLKTHKTVTTDPGDDDEDDIAESWRPTTLTELRRGPCSGPLTLAELREQFGS